MKGSVRRRLSFRRLVAASLLFLACNAADVLTTWLAIRSGKGAEANPLILLSGGPFSPLALTLKLVIVPGIILAVAWLLWRISKQPLAFVAILPSAVGLAVVSVHNLMIAIAGKKPKPVGRGEK